MEPQTNPNSSPESKPTSLPKPEVSPLIPDTSLEQELPTPEKIGPAGERANQSAPVAPATSLPQPMETTPADEPGAIGATPTDEDTAVTGPAFADDVDVLEKEWVDKAKKIVDETRQDPYKQEGQVSDLQADYLRKRYGKVVKTSE